MNRYILVTPINRWHRFANRQKRSLVWASSLMLLAACVIWQISARSMVSARTAAPATAVAQSGGCNNCCGTWGQKSNTGPVARDIHAMAYARACNRVVLFGGRGVGGIPPANVLNDTWEWNGTTMTWTQFTPATRPAARGQHAMAYDAARNEVVLFGGFNQNFVGLNDTWIYSCATHTWTQRFPATSPAIRHGHSMAYDPNLQLVVMYGGGSNKEDTWTWNGTNWAQISATSPPGIRHEHAMAFDGTRVILFGGSKNAGNADNDTWGFNGTTWTMLAPNSSGPGKRYRHAMTQEPGCRKVILFGGSVDFIGRANDTWEWNGATLTWCQVSVSGTPPSPVREYPAMAYDGRGALMFGGLNNNLSQLGDTWRYACSKQYTYSAGYMDNFSFPTPIDPMPLPNAAFLANINSVYSTPARKKFDDPADDKWVLHSFSSLPANIVKAELEVRMKPGTGSSDNDSIHLDFPPFNAPNFTWGKNIRNLHSGGTWNPGQGASTFLLDLCNLPAGGVGQPTNLMSQLNATHSLHIMIQDDTIVDYIKLRVTVCPPPLKFAGLTHEPLNNASLEVVTTPTGGENLRSVPPDIKVNLGNATGWIANLLPTNDLRANGSVLESWIKGRVGGVDDQFIGKSKITGNGAAATYTADFSTIGSPNALIQLLDPEGQTVGSFTAPNAAAIQFMCPTGSQAVTVCSSAWVCEANGDRDLVRFCNTTCVTYGGQTYNNVSTMRVTALGITQSREFISEGVLCGANIGALTITDESVQVGRKPVSALGGALLAPDSGGGLSITNIGSSGEDGISFSAKAGYDLRLYPPRYTDDVEATIPKGASLDMQSTLWPSVIGGSPYTDIVSVAKLKNKEMKLTSKSSNTNRILAFDGTTNVAQENSFTGYVVVSNWPTGFRRDNANLLTAKLDFPTGTTLSFVPCAIGNCEPIPITSVEMTAVNAPIIPAYLTNSRILAAELPEITINNLSETPLCGSTITLSPATLPSGTVNAAYSQTLSASGGVAPYSFALTAGTLPPGLSFNNLTSVLSGSPTQVGTFSFTIEATDDDGCKGTQEISITVRACAVTLDPSSRNLSAAAASTNVAVTTVAGCQWQATSNAAWLTLTGSTSGTGNGTVNYQVGANTGASRTGTITVSGVTHTVFQASADATQDSDGDGIPDSVEIAEGRNPLVKDNDIFANTPTGRRLFVMQQYRDFLGREGDTGGIQAWVDLLANNSLTQAQVIQSFFNSPEFQQYGAPIVRLYFAYFRRIPDYEGQLFWTNQLRGGMSLEAISQVFATSPEFTLTYGSLDNTQFITLVYQNVLNRTPSPAEVAAWVALLNQGASRGQVMAGFSESPEYKLQSANKVFVVMMYVGMLRRAPEQAGFDGWVALLDGGTSQLVLTQAFLDAPEYRNRFLP